MKQPYTGIKTYLVLVAVIFTLIAQQTRAQAPQIQWAKCFGGSDNDRAKDIHRTADSGYVVCGFTSSTDGNVTNNHGGIDGWVVKLDVAGTLQWQKTYGGSNDDALNAIRELKDGGYIACGYTGSTDGDVDSLNGAKDFWVVRTDAFGNILWEKTFGGTSDDVANDIATTADTGFVVVGYTFSADGDVDQYKGDGDGWIVYVDTVGNLLRQKDKGGHDYDELKSVITANNGGFVVVGLTYSNSGTVSGLSHGGSDAWVARLSKFGTDQWNALFGDSLDDGAYDVHTNTSHQFVVSGHRDFSGNNDSWLFSMDSLGGFVPGSGSTHGGSDQELDGATFERTAGNDVVAGSSNSSPSGDKDCLIGGYDFWMYNTNAGVISWQKCMGGTETEICSRGQVSSNDGAIGLCGWTNSNDNDVEGNHGDYDFWVVRLLDSCDVTAGFTFTQSGDTVTFTNTSFDATDFLWTFGDGSTSTDINPIHIYAEPGSYTVCLVATSSCASDTLCTEVNTGCTPPTAAFSYSEDSLTVTFTDLSNGATSWSWTFGDGGTSTDQNPTHTYSSFATYTVCLTVSNDCDTTTACQEVLVCPPVDAAFDYSTNSLTVSFSDFSSGATSWQWTFGDGGTSNDQNPTYVYSASGTYTVCLIASNFCRSDTSCTEVTVECVQVSAGFSSSANGLAVSFSDLSSGATSWQWDFGDGNTSTDQNPIHTYLLPGTYTVCLVASNDCSVDSSCSEVTVECLAPTAGFDYSTSGLTVSFTDLSAGATSWQWDFGDGNTSTDQNPTHSYLAEGTYTVCLMISNVCGMDTFCTEVTVQCTPFESDGFDFSVNGLTVTFTDLSYGPLSWFWTFGDGNTSNLENPVHTYDSSGTYTVCMYVSNECVTDTFCNEVTVECAPFQADFSWSAVFSTASFIDESIGAISWSWTFGDGGTSTEQNPTHTYDCFGIAVYTVCLTAFDGCTSSTFCDTIDLICEGVSEISQQQNFDIYPNPFSDVATVSFTLTESSSAIITLTDVQGRLLNTLLSSHLSAGDHSIIISKKNLPAGIYLLQLKAGSESLVRRLVIE